MLKDGGAPSTFGLKGDFVTYYFIFIACLNQHLITFYSRSFSSDVDKFTLSCASLLLAMIIN